MDESAALNKSLLAAKFALDSLDSRLDPRAPPLPTACIVDAPSFLLESPSRHLAVMAGFRNVGDTIRADYARMEAKLRGELRKEMNAELCEYSFL